MKRLVIVLLCAIWLLTACGAKKELTGGALQAYFVDNTESTVVMKDYIPQAASVEAQIEEVLALLRTVPEKLEYKAPLAMGFQLLDYQLEDGTLLLNMDSAYDKLSATTEVLVRACLVSTLTQVDGIEAVSVTVEGAPLYDALGKLVGSMRREQFINNPGNEIGNYETAFLTLYFTNETGDGLIAVNREKRYNTNISLDKLVVDELIAGPSVSVDMIYPVLNPATKTISVLTKDGICYVNLNAEFLNQVTNATAEVMIYSIVNSLTELNTVDKVQIAIDGDTSGTFREKFSFGTVYERNESLITVLEIAQEKESEQKKGSES